MAGTKNESRLFRTPMANAAKDTRIKKGNIHCVMEIASEALTESKPGAIILTRNGDRITPAKTTAVPATRRIHKACLAK